MISKADKIATLQIIKSRHFKYEPSGELTKILIELEDDGMINITYHPFTVDITYRGLSELNNWDSLLQVITDHHLLESFGVA